MKHYLRKILSIIIVLNIYTCNSDSILTTTPMADDEIKEKIVGKWVTGSQKRSFFEDGTFHYEIYFKTVVDTSEWRTDIEYSGKYSILDGIMTCSDIDVVNNNEWASSGLYGWGAEKITIEGKKIAFTKVEVLTSVYNINGIIGSWESKRWLTTFGRDTSTIKYRGYVYITYSFLDDSTTYVRENRFGFSSGVEPILDRDMYIYNEPMLKIVNPVLMEYTVEFEDDKMYWYLDSRSFSLYRE